MLWLTKQKQNRTKQNRCKEILTPYDEPSAFKPCTLLLNEDQTHSIECTLTNRKWREKESHNTTNKMENLIDCFFRALIFTWNWKIAIHLSTYTQKITKANISENCCTICVFVDLKIDDQMMIIACITFNASSLILSKNTCAASTLIGVCFFCNKQIFRIYGTDLRDFPFHIACLLRVFSASSSEERKKKKPPKCE